MIEEAACIVAFRIEPDLVLQRLLWTFLKPKAIACLYQKCRPALAEEITHCGTRGAQARQWLDSAIVIAAQRL